MLAVPAWNGALTKLEKDGIEKVQKTAMLIILGESYSTYMNALNIVDLEQLDTSRNRNMSKICEEVL